MQLSLSEETGPAASAVLHWETLQQLGACLGDTLLLSARNDGCEIALHAWASARVAPGRVGLASEVRAALGLQQGRASLRARLASSMSPPEARSLDLSALDAAHAEELEAIGLQERPRLGWLVAQLLDWPVAEAGVLPLRLHGRPLPLRVVRALGFEGDGSKPGQSGGVWRVTSRTKIALVPPRAAANGTAGSAPTKSNPLRSGSGPPAIATAIQVPEVAGMARVVAHVREAIELPLRHRALFDDFGVAPPTGLLLHGPPGTGKTLIARSLCAALGIHVAELGTAQLLSSEPGDAEATLSAAFSDARARAPAVLFLDEIDGLGAARDDSGGGGTASESRLLALLLTEMDGIRVQPEALLVLGATNRPDALDPALRRPGRFDTEIEVGVPSESERCGVLAGLFARTPHALDAGHLDEAAACTAGFVGADLAALHRHAALAALGRREGVGRGGMEDAGASGCISWADMEAALKTVKPSALREVELRVPTVSWDDIGGQEVLKATLDEAVQWPLRHPEAFQQLGIRPPRGVLLYGPPGCSKTLAAKALAAESRTNFLAVKGPELFSKWVGESERAVAALFRRARAAAPAIIFFDEIDALAAKRGSGEGGGGVAARVLSQLLHEMDGVQPLTSVLVVAATNRPDLVDPALLRPGRFDSLIHVGLPDESGRLQVLRIHTRKMPMHDDVCLADLAMRTNGYSGAELAAITREAALAALEESDGADTVAMRHIDKALCTVPPRTTAQTLQFFAEYERKARGALRPTASNPTQASGKSWEEKAQDAGFTPPPPGFTFRMPRDESSDLPATATAPAEKGAPSVEPAEIM